MKKILAGIIAVVMGVMMVGAPVAAADCPDGCVPTAILGENGCSCDDGTQSGSQIKHILSLVVEIMTIGVGVLGVIGITISGLQYLTAGGSEEKTKKAKRRLFEIVLGIVIYVVLFVLLKWLIPDFEPFS